MPIKLKKVEKNKVAVKKTSAIIKTKPPKRKQNEEPEKVYTYRVLCSFTIQYSFPESEVIPDPEGRKGAFIPTDKAVCQLEEDLIEIIGYNYSVSDLVADVESDDLLGIC
jgi:hypothetical protein